MKSIKKRHCARQKVSENWMKNVRTQWNNFIGIGCRSGNFIGIGWPPWFDGPIFLKTVNKMTLTYFKTVNGKSGQRKNANENQSKHSLKIQPKKCNEIFFQTYQEFFRVPNRDQNQPLSFLLETSSSLIAICHLAMGCYLFVFDHLYLFTFIKSNISLIKQQQSPLSI